MNMIKKSCQSRGQILDLSLYLYFPLARVQEQPYGFPCGNEVVDQLYFV